MSENPPKDFLDAVVKLSAPFVDKTNCDETTLHQLYRNHREIISKLNQTDRLLLLNVDGQTLLVCDAKPYFDLEHRRQCLISRFKTVEDALQLGTVDGEIISDPRVIELQELERRITKLDADIADDLWRTNQDQKELADLRTRAATLVDDLKKPETNT